LRHIFNSVNGVLFPGGGSSLQNTPLFKAGQFLLEAAIKVRFLFSLSDLVPLLLGLTYFLGK
jgi:hypothetical protein